MPIFFIGAGQNIIRGIGRGGGGSKYHNNILTCGSL